MNALCACVCVLMVSLPVVFPSEITELKQKLHMLNLLVLLLPEPNRNTLKVRTVHVSYGSKNLS